MAKPTTTHHKKLNDTIETITQFVHDTSVENVDARPIKNWNTTLGVFSALDRRSTLLTGNPGSGKTTFAAVASSVIFGLPYDIFDTFKIQGHPDHTKDTLLARIDLGKLAEEEVVWQGHMYLPAVIIDEVNRLQPGKQGTILEYVRTGIASHLNRAFFSTKPAFFATMNFNGPGTYPLTQAFLDRFDISMEMGTASSVEYEEIMEKKAKINEIRDLRMTKDITAIVGNKTIDADQKLELIARKRKNTALDAVVQEAQRIPLNVAAKGLLCSIIDEMNMSYLYGVNRAGESPDTSTHNQSFASTNIQEGLGFRAYETMQYFAKMLALYLNEPDQKTGKIEVTPHHLFAVAPYILSHRLQFTEEFTAQYVDTPRKTNKNHHLTTIMLANVKEHYAKIEPQLALMDMFYAGKHLTEKQEAIAKDFLKGPKPDHPVLRAYWEHGTE